MPSSDEKDQRIPRASAASKLPHITSHVQINPSATSRFLRWIFNHNIHSICNMILQEIALKKGRQVVGHSVSQLLPERCTQTDLSRYNHGRGRVRSAEAIWTMIYVVMERKEVWRPNWGRSLPGSMWKTLQTSRRQRRKPGLLTRYEPREQPHTLY